MPRYRVTLTLGEKETLLAMTSKGSNTNKVFKYAHALLLCDMADFADHKWSTEQTAEAVGLTARSVINLKQRFVEGGLDKALQRKPQERPSRPKIFDGAFEARLTKLACSEPPEGHARWTVHLLADELVELKIVEKISPMTVQRALKKQIAASLKRVLENT